MDIKKYALVDHDGNVVNCVAWDGVTPISFSDQLIEYTDDNPAYVDGTYVDGVFLPPPEEPEVPPEVN